MSIPYGPYADGPPPGSQTTPAAVDQGSVVGGFYGGERSAPAGPSGAYGSVFGRPSSPEQPFQPQRPVQEVEDDAYYEGDAPAILSNLTTERLTRLQQQMVALGLMDPPSFGFGEVDPGQTEPAFNRILAMANRRGEEWEQTVGRLSTRPQEAQEAQEFQPQPYLAPDYSDLAQRVKDTFRNRLDREPDDYELQQLAAELQGYHSLQYEREQEWREMAFDAEQQEGVQEPGQLDAVDPMGRFMQRFDELYSGEMDFIEDKESAALQRVGVQGAVDLASQASRGDI